MGETTNVPRPDSNVVKPAVVEMKRSLPSQDAIKMAQFVDKHVQLNTKPELVIRAIGQAELRRNPEQDLPEQQKREALLRATILTRVKPKQAEFIAEEFYKSGKAEWIERNKLVTFLANTLDKVEQTGWDAFVAQNPSQAETFKDMPEVKAAIERKAAREAQRLSAEKGSSITPKT